MNPNNNSNFGNSAMSTWSPMRTTKTTGADALLTASPFAWLTSPMSGLDVLSPESTMSFSLSSPPRPTSQAKGMDVSPCQEGISDILAATFSPSIFSPEDKSHHNRPVLKDAFQVSSMFPLFSEITSPPGFGIGEQYEDLGFEDDFSKKVANTKKMALLNKLSQNTENVANNNINLLPKKEKQSVRQITLKAKKLNKNLVVTPESTIVPALLSPDLDSSRKLSLDAAPHTGDSSQGDSDSSSTQMITSSKKSSKNSVSNNSNPSSRTICNCKKSKCLKLYCDCFAVLNYCDPHYCNCTQCYNVSIHEDVRNDAIKATKERNVLAFKTKISEQEQHVTGCHCKNSHCLKKYCECFNGGALCGSNCKCQSCQNYSGSAELAKTRESSPKFELPTATVGGSASKKRKESPNSIVWANGSPDSMDVSSTKIPTGPASIHMVNMKVENKKAPYSLRPSKDAYKVTTMASTSSSSSSYQLPNPYVKESPHMVPTTTAAMNVVDSKKTPIAPSSSIASIPGLPVPSSSSSSGSSSNNHNSVYANPQLTIHDSGSSSNSNNTRQIKKRKVKFSTPSVTYPFFGEQHSEAPKLVALRVLEFLTGKELYAMSQVSSLWNNAVLDDAMWE